MQLVLMQSFIDEFELLEGSAVVMPAEPGSVLMKAREDEKVDTKTQTMFRSGVGKLIHEMVATGCTKCSARSDKANECGHDVPRESNETGDDVPDGDAETRIDLEAKRKVGQQQRIRVHNFEIFRLGFCKGADGSEKCEWMGGLFEWGTYFDAKQDARLQDIVGDRSGISGCNSLCAGHVVFDAADGIDRLDSQEANGVDSGQ